MALGLGKRTRGLLGLAGVVAWLCLVEAWAAKPDVRPVFIPVEPLGFQLIPSHFQSTGATMFTVNFVDERHLLFTFNKRTLMPRLPDSDPSDDDRVIQALLLELPTGKVLAQAQWRTRDRDRYLWPLEHGRFLLRVRSKLTVVDPLRNFEKQGGAEAFRQQTLLEFNRPIGYLTVSPGGDLLGIETLPPPKPKRTGVKADAAALAVANGAKSDGQPETEHAPIQIHFFRLVNERPDGNGHLVVRTAGTVGAANLITLPATGDGFLDVKRESAGVWLFDFVSHTGKRLELSPYDTSCAPHPHWLSRSEFVAFGCRGSEQKQELSYFTLKGEQPWISVFSGMHVSPSIVAAPAAGRFALSRTLIASTLFDTENLTADDLTGQEITVQSNYDGRVLLKVLATPIQRAGQNFDLSPAGSQFAVLRAGNLEVHPLPALNGREEKALHLAQALTPEANDGVVRMGAVPVSPSRSEAESRTDAAAIRPASTEASPGVEPPAASPAAVSAPPAEAVKEAAHPPPAALPASDAVQSDSHVAPTVTEGAPEVLGDQPQRGPRKAPSLYSADHPRQKGEPPASAPPAPETPQ